MILVKWVAIGAVAGIAALALWVRIAGDRAIDILDEDYPPARDSYLDRLFVGQ